MRFLLVFFITIIIFFSCKKETPHDWQNTKTVIIEAIHDVEALDDKNAFAYSYGTGNLYKTENGGVEWKKIHQFDSIFFEQIQFLNDQVGWICGTPNTLYKTENGGKDWIDYTLTQEPDDILIYGMYFKDLENGYVAAIDGYKNRKPSSNIYATQNGGKEWKLVNTIPGTVLNLEEINGILYGSGDCMIIENIDKKEKWKYSYLDTLGKVKGIRDLQINSQGKMLATSMRGYILEYTDNAWTAKKVTSNWLRNLTWVKDKTWIAVGDAYSGSGNMLISYDDGKNWEPYQNYFPGIHRIVKSENKLWAVGKQGVFLTKEIESF